MKLLTKLAAFILLFSIVGCEEKRADQPASEAQQEMQDASLETEESETTENKALVNEAKDTTEEDALEKNTVENNAAEKSIQAMEDETNSTYEEVKEKIDKQTNFDEAMENAKKSAEDAQLKAEEQTKTMLEKANAAAKKTMENAQKKADSTSDVLQSEKERIEKNAKRGKELIKQNNQ